MRSSSNKISESPLNILIVQFIFWISSFQMTQKQNKNQCGPCAKADKGRLCIMLSETPARETQPSGDITSEYLLALRNKQNRRTKRTNECFSVLANRCNELTRR
jgi:hypothetical protein